MTDFCHFITQEALNVLKIKWFHMKGRRKSCVRISVGLCFVIFKFRCKTDCFGRMVKHFYSKRQAATVIFVLVYQFQPRWLRWIFKLCFYVNIRMWDTVVISFHELVVIGDNLLFFYMRLNSANEDVWLQGFNRIWKLETRREGSRRQWHANNICVIFDTVRGYTLTVITFIVGGEIRNSGLPNVCAKALATIYALK